MKNHDRSKNGFTLIEVLTVSMLLAVFLVGFYLGSQRMAMAAHLQQNRTEALLQLKRVGNKWRAGQNISTITGGNFINGTAYTVGSTSTSYSATNASLTKLALTVGWREPDPNSTTSRKQQMKDLYFKY